MPLKYVIEQMWDWAVNDWWSRYWKWWYKEAAGYESLLALAFGVLIFPLYAPFTIISLISIFGIYIPIVGFLHGLGWVAKKILGDTIK